MLVATDTATSALDVNELLGRCLGKTELVQRVLTRFQKQLSDDLVRIGAAVAAGDSAVVASVAHRIKGAAANVSAHAVHLQAASLETAARAAEWEQIPAELDGLSTERDEFEIAWQQLGWRLGT
jgi:HPt (histidine-containing phosphotransfer) domain-containing protein